MATKEPARDAKEFFDKYSRKRYTAENAGLYSILNYIYLTLLQYAGSENDSLPPSLYTPDRQEAIVYKALTSDDDSDIPFLVGMQNLVGWLATAHDSALIERNAADTYIKTAQKRINSLDPLSRILESSQMENPDVLETLIKRGKADRAEFLEMRGWIVNSMSFVYAYNTLIDMIGKELSIPEFYVFRMISDNTQSAIKKLNRYMLDYEELQNKPDYLLVDTSPITIPPLPKENIDNALFYVRRAIRNKEAWSVTLTQITKNYWRRDNG